MPRTEDEGFRPFCPQCLNTKVYKKGKTANGQQKWKCVNCDHYWRDNPFSEGRPTILPDRPLTPYEKLKRHTEKNKKQFEK
jgi:Zn-finger protein